MRALSSRNTQSNIVLRNEIDKIRLLFRKDRESYLCFYRILGFYPRNIQLYEQALLHKSTSVRSDKGRPLNNQRLEFLGDAILDAIDALPAPDSDVPTVIIGKTVKGHGVSFMENNVSWHAGCVNEADWIKAKAEITEAYERKWGAEA